MMKFKIKFLNNLGRSKTLPVKIFLTKLRRNYGQNYSQNYFSFGRSLWKEKFYV